MLGRYQDLNGAFRTVFGTIQFEFRKKIKTQLPCGLRGKYSPKVADLQSENDLGTRGNEPDSSYNLNHALIQAIKATCSPWAEHWNWAASKMGLEKIPEFSEASNPHSPLPCQKAAGSRGSCKDGGLQIYTIFNPSSNPRGGKSRPDHAFSL